MQGRFAAVPVVWLAWEAKVGPEASLVLLALMVSMVRLGHKARTVVPMEVMLVMAVMVPMAVPEQTG